MVFSEFVQKLSKSIRAGSNTAVFTKSIIEAVLTEEGLDILSEYKGTSSFKGFYNGSTSIAGLAKKSTPILNPKISLPIFTNFPMPQSRICAMIS